MSSECHVDSEGLYLGLGVDGPVTTNGFRKVSVVMPVDAKVTRLVFQRKENSPSLATAGPNDNTAVMTVAKYHAGSNTLDAATDSTLKAQLSGTETFAEACGCVKVCKGSLVAAHVRAETDVEFSAAVSLIYEECHFRKEEENCKQEESCDTNSTEGTDCDDPPQESGHCTEDDGKSSDSEEEAKC
jgi:hypothetical protein